MNLVKRWLIEKERTAIIDKKARLYALVSYTAELEDKGKLTKMFKGYGKAIQELEYLQTKMPEWDGRLSELNAILDKPDNDYES